MAGSALIGNLAVTLGLNTAAFERGATKAEARAKTLQGRLGGIGKSIATFGAGLGIGFGVAALGAMTKSAFDMASALDETAQKSGVTVEALQELNLAATQNGVSQESLAGAMAKLNKNMGLLAQGSKPTVEAFAKIGLAAEDLKGKSPDQALRIIADRLNALPTVQERVAVGAQLMGRGFSELLPLINQGSAGLDHYAEVSQRNGQITTEEAKKLDELADSWERLKVRAGVATAKIIAGMADFVDKANAWLASWEVTRDGFIASFISLEQRAVSAVNALVEGVRNAVVGRLNAIWEGAKQKIESVRQKFEQLYDDVVGHSYVPDMVEEIGREFAQLGRIMVDPSISATDKVAAAFQGLQSILSDVLGKKAGGIFSLISSFIPVLKPLLGGIFGGGVTPGGPASLSGVYPGVDPSLVPGMARGGGGVFGGMPGVDKNVLSLNGSPIARVSRGESFNVGGAANSNGRVVIELRDDMLDARIADGSNVQIVRAYPSISAGIRKSINERGRRSA